MKTHKHTYQFMKHFDIGYPKVFGRTHIGLYQPVLGCFLLTLCDLKQAQEIKLLASSRYSLYSIDLTTAKNYCPNIIDNDCCENWTLSNRKDIEVGSSWGTQKILCAEELVPCSTVDPDIQKEKEHLQLIWYYVRYYLQLCLNDTHYEINQFIHDVMGINDHNFQCVQSFIANAKKTLYLGRDSNGVEQDMQSHIEKYLMDFQKVTFNQ